MSVRPSISDPQSHKVMTRLRSTPAGRVGDVISADYTHHPGVSPKILHERADGSIMDAPGC